MVRLNISKGLKMRLAGRPEKSVARIGKPDTVAVSARDIPHIRPKLMVKEGESVKTGSPLFFDKRDKSVRYVSPGTGTVKQILFGPRRKLLEVVIALDGPEDFIQFEPLSPGEADALPLDALVSRLKEGGVWQFLRQMPARDTAHSAHKPPLIIVSLNGNDMFSPDPGLLLENRQEEFLFGLGLLERFCKRIVVTARKESFDGLGPLASHVTHVTPDQYPAWDPAVVLYHIKDDPAQNSAWTISAEGLIMMAKFLLSGTYPVDRIITVTGAGKKPHFLARQGAPVRQFFGSVEEGDLITTGPFNGRVVDPESHIGFFENTLNIIPRGPEDQMFGFIRPGLDVPTISKAFLSSLWDREHQVDGALHGEERACINCSYCESICPTDLMPNFIMKALVSDDIEEALQMGLMDCALCGLCSFVCPAKIELTHILALGMDTHYKDKA